MILFSSCPPLHPTNQNKTLTVVLHVQRLKTFHFMQPCAALTLARRKEHTCFSSSLTLSCSWLQMNMWPTFSSSVCARTSHSNLRWKMGPVLPRQQASKQKITQRSQGLTTVGAVLSSKLMNLNSYYAVQISYLHIT